MLDGVGLGDAEEKAYRILLRAPSITVRDLADALDIPAANARRSADLLVESGLATVLDGSPARYSAVDPRISIPALVRLRQADLERTTAAVGGYAAEFHERLLRTEPQRLVEILDGPTAISDRLTTLLRTADTEVLAFDEPPYVAQDPNDLGDEYDMLARGVTVRAIYAAEVLELGRQAQTIRDLVAAGEQARVVPRVPVKMVLVDRRAAIMPLTAGEESTRTTAIVVWESRLCDALVELFEATWARGTTVFAAPTGDRAADVDPVDRELLVLLSAGLKDETVARQLGLSERTVRRRIADLLDRLDVTSRFQAGAEAVRRGWL